MPGWRYYLHAAIPTTLPHEEVDTDDIEKGTIWKSLSGGGTVYFARWTSEWDCGYKTNWWYIVKDTPFDISALKSKRRYEITKGNRNFVVKIINPIDYADELYQVSCKAYETYPASYRPKIYHNTYIEGVKRWRYHKVYAAFSSEGDVCGFAAINMKGNCIEFSVMKSIPATEKLGVNAALINAMLIDNEELLKNGYYICDGERSIQHETAFQDYLEKYFGFRKAYCQLNIKYNPRFYPFIKIIKRCRRILMHFDSIGVVHQILLVFEMDDLSNSYN